MSEVWTVEDQISDRRRRLKATTFDERLRWLRGAQEIARESGALQRARQLRLTDADPEVMAFARVRDICMTFGDVERAEIQGRPLFRVGKYRFAIFNSAWAPPRARWANSGCSLHFLADPSEADALRGDPRFSPSPHHGDRGWFAVCLDEPRPDWTEIEELLTSAHAQVSRRKPNGSS
jgi:predicted DNA-binding protein (MmcQ/YjbR family)